jgi:hypothetical protein
MRDSEYCNYVQCRNMVDLIIVIIIFDIDITNIYELSIRHRGYDSWRPTIQSFLKLRCFDYQTYFIVTSYTIEESEDDYDTIDEILNSSGKKQCSWLWDCELNPNRSEIQLERLTACNERKYYENYAWQCFSIS